MDPSEEMTAFRDEYMAAAGVAALFLGGVTLLVVAARLVRPAVDGLAKVDLGSVVSATAQMVSAMTADRPAERSVSHRQLPN
jgi:hypothetical protein